MICKRLDIYYIMMMMFVRLLVLFVILHVSLCETIQAVEHDSDLQYISYFKGDYPLIISVPHGGYIEPRTIPSRQNGCFRAHTCIYKHGCGSPSSYCEVQKSRDSNTKEIAQALQENIYRLTGHFPHVVINELHRRKLDANRERDIATFGESEALHAYGNYSLFIQKAISLAGLLGDGRALFVDIHGQTHSEEWVELGYLISGSNLNRKRRTAVASHRTSIKHLMNRRCTSVQCKWRLINGDWSLGHFLNEALYKTSFSEMRVVPSPDNSGPEGGNYFSGGYNTKTYGSKDCANIDAIQIELPRLVRFGNWSEFTGILAKALIEFIQFHEYDQDYE